MLIWSSSSHSLSLPRLILTTLRSQEITFIKDGEKVGKLTKRFWDAMADIQVSLYLGRLS